MRGRQTKAILESAKHLRYAFANRKLFEMHHVVFYFMCECVNVHGAISIYSRWCIRRIDHVTASLGFGVRRYAAAEILSIDLVSLTGQKKSSLDSIRSIRLNTIIIMLSLSLI